MSLAHRLSGRELLKNPANSIFRGPVGGDKQRRLCQLLADVIVAPPFRTVDHEIGAKGAFIVGLGVLVGKKSIMPAQ